MADPTIIEGIFRNLDIYLEQLHLLAASGIEELANDLVKQGAVKYYLHIAIECCIDAANHIIADEGFRAPQSYVDSFSVLVENGVVDASFLPTVHNMVRMRNRLVHLYWDVDMNTLYGILQSNLGDFDQYKTFIVEYLDRK
ncbi:MAG: DUF86 domain-containing protein [Chloroflexi bacterium]|nr:DUF86 domain-containing protein [Chloroflexota bacterium]MCI0579611.1 DUF86 domain-containing protein [Chloroflexota bacterium]MCI0644828.1 DUF86 domain-containing protein [Chloroflexota bacterium]MCI0731446.1 DUF86 domain-containing protein [Chloroflexota bacterium]